MDYSTLYDNPTSPKPVPAKPDTRYSRSASTSFPDLTEQEQFAKLYDRPVKAGESIAWRTAVSGPIAEGLLTQADADRQEVRVLGAMKQAGLPDTLIDVITKTAIGKPPADAETREKWQRETFRRVQEEHGEARVEILKGIDDLMAKNPEVKRLLHSTGALYAPSVATALAEHVRRQANERRLQKYLAAKAAKES